MNNQSGGLLRLLDSWLMRRPWAPTTAGLLWITFSLLLLLQGLLRGFNLVTFIATFLVAMWVLNLVVTLFSGARLKPLRLKRRLLGSVHVGTPVMLSIELENTGQGRATGVRVLEHGHEHQKSLGVNYLDAGQKVEFRQQVVPQYRGYFPWNPMLVSTGNPFGLFRRTTPCPSDQTQTLVLPMLGQVDQQQFQRWLRNSQRTTTMQTRTKSRRSVAPADFYGIRAYRPGDSPRWIHWRTTARVGVPMVREFEEPPQDHITVLVDISLPEQEAKLQQQWLEIRRKNLHDIRMHFRQYGTPSAEEVNFKLAEVKQTEAAFAEPLHLVEQAISLAASLCQMWTRKLGSTITLAVLDHRTELPIRLDSGPNLRQLLPLMERLALAQSTVQHDIERLRHALEHRALPPGPIILITPGNNSQAGQLVRRLSRPVQQLDMSQTRQVRRFFRTQAQACLLGIHSHEQLS